MTHRRGARWRPAAGLAVVTLLVGLSGQTAQAAGVPLRSFATSFTDTCTVIGRTVPVPAQVTGRLPAAVPAGGSFRLDRLVFSARIPAELATDAYDLGARRAQLRLQVVNARGVGVLPRVVDVLPRDVVLALPVRRGRPLPFTTAGVTVPAALFQAGSTPGTGLLQAGGVRATITLFTADGSVLDRDEPVTCARPAPDVTVTSIRIT